MILKKILSSLETELRTLRGLVYYRFFGNKKLERDITEEFTKFYYNAGTFNKTWKSTFWLGTRIRKFPMDLVIYQEIIFEIKPDVIIESGTADGGSALFLASICDAIGNGRVITIDIEEKWGRPKHKRITYLKGSSTSEEIVGRIEKLVKEDEKVLVILDSDHHEKHVLNELRIYSRFVTKGSYLIVEDTIVNGHPVEPQYGPGPMEAVEKFLKENKDFVVDKKREKLYVTCNPGGYLKKIR